MRLNMSFTTPFSRAQIRAGLNNLALPSGADVRVAEVPAVRSINATPDSENNEIHRLIIDGFTTLEEVADLIASLPISIDTRFAGIEITP